MIQVEIKFSHFLSTQYHNTWGAVVFKLNTRVPFASYTDGWGAHAFRDGNHREGDAGNRTISQKSMHRTWSRYYVRIAMKK